MITQKQLARFVEAAETATKALRAWSEMRAEILEQLQAGEQIEPGEWTASTSQPQPTRVQ